MSFTDDAIKTATNSLRSHVSRKFGSNLKPTHAHELFAAYAGYNSKVALKADSFELDPDNPDCFTADSEAASRIQSRMKTLKGVPVGPPFAFEAVSIIEEAISPTCDFCGDDHKNTQHVESEAGSSLLWACPSCSEEEPELGHCNYCGTGHLFHASMLNNAGECLDHAGESEYTEEEQEDLESFAEYLQNH